MNSKDVIDAIVEDMIRFAKTVDERSAQEVRLFMQDVKRRLRRNLRDRLPPPIYRAVRRIFFGDNRSFFSAWMNARRDLSIERSVHLATWLNANGIDVELFELRPDVWSRSDQGPLKSWRVMSNYLEAFENEGARAGESV